MLFFSRFTTAFSSPGTPAVVVSTRAEQAAQVMPVMSNRWVVTSCFGVSD
jgi:hypothetical protein